MKRVDELRQTVERQARLALARPTVRMAELCGRAMGALNRCLERLADPEVARILTREAYGRTGRYAQSWDQELGLYDFERAALDEFFPPPPAELLVMGCGGGRELVALDAEGYRCTGSDPAPELVRAASRKLARKVPVVVASLERMDPQPVLAGPFDGVIVGWGAWGHVLRRTERVAALTGLLRRCPRGPVLLSWTYEQRRGLRGSLASPQAIRVGGPERHPTSSDDWRASLVATPEGKFHARLGRRAIEEEALAAGYRRVEYRDGGSSGFPNAVLLP